MKKRKTILITGAAGFIGFHLAEALLRKGHRVIGVDSLTDYYDVRMKQRRLAFLKKYPKFSFTKLSVLEYEKLLALMKRSRVTDIYHLAAQAGVRYSISHPRSYGENNYVGTLNVFEAARVCGVRRVVYASSSTVYGARSRKGAFSETDVTDTPLSVYGATKIANEALAHAYASAYGMEMIGIRFFTVYGAFGRPDLGMFIFTKRIMEGKTVSLFNYGKTRRAFTHVSDVIPPLVNILKKPVRSGSSVYNLGGTESISLTTLITHIERALGKRAKVKLTPPVIGDMPETIADCRRAMKDLAYRPKMDIKKGVEEFAAWYRENNGWLKTLSEPKS
jgi:UDP-glucuronate 4-epimerase